MNTQKVLTGMAIGAAVAGIGFIAFHPGGKKMRNMIADLGCAAIDKMTEAISAEVPKMAKKVVSETTSK
ncbi:MAG: hypothetical protein ABI763_10680 [Bacteroidota bacterium]